MDLGQAEFDTTLIVILIGLAAVLYEYCVMRNWTFLDGFLLANSMKPTSSAPAVPRVLVFDSGVGGLSIAEPIMARFPGVGITYCADNRYFPYGTKPEDVVRQRVCDVIQAMTEKYPVQLIVIACNTATMVALEAVRFQS